MRKLILLLLLTVLVLAACERTTPRHLDLFPTATVPPTEVSPVPTSEETQTPNVVIMLVTPTSLGVICVNASVAVYLRPSPSNEFYPLLVIPNGAEVVNLGGRSRKWMFVQYGDATGWVHGDYLDPCS
jgi:hypothetical protein